MRAIASVLLSLAAGLLFAQDSDAPVPIGKGITPPRVTRKVDPVYSKEAERAHIQGTALYSIIVDKNGRPRDIQILSPLGYGLDEMGLAAIQKWEFTPGMKDGMPVNVRAEIEVNFRFPGLPFDSNFEANRTAYNRMIQNLQTENTRSKGLEELRRLAKAKYPPAWALLGEMMIDGKNIPQDVAGGMDLIRKAAEKDDSNGLYAWARLNVDGTGVPPDFDKGMKLMREASLYGSSAAQLWLGNRYETGDAHIAADPNRARQFFRMCAARDNTACQLHLGRLLSPATGPGSGDPVQALAWLELAEEGKAKDAEGLAQSLRGALSPDEILRAEKLKSQLLRK